jgi:hypothetical protein
MVGHRGRVGVQTPAGSFLSRAAVRCLRARHGAARAEVALPETRPPLGPRRRARRSWRVVVLTIACALSALGSVHTACAQPRPSAPPAAERPRQPTPFDQGRLRFGLGLGTAGPLGDGGVVIGTAFGWYALDGLELGLETQHWFGGTLPMHQVSPGLRYVAWFIPKVHPYVGAFYRHWFILEDEPDLDTVGTRAGAFITGVGRSLLGIGVVWERFLQDPGVGLERTVVYPEVFVSLAF